MRELYPCQQKHLQVLMAALENYRGALDGSITGAGKTLVAAELAKESERPTFVVCPKSGVPMWTNELKERGANLHGVLNYEMLRMGKTSFGHWVSGRTRLWQWTLPEDAFVIWDECQKLQGMNTQNARMGWSAKPYYNLLLSATAAEDPTEMKALGYLLSLHDLKGFWNWTKMHGCKPGIFGGLVFSGMDEDIDRIHQIIYPRHGSRLSRKDMAPYFKETHINMTPLDFGKDVKALYAEMAQQLEALRQQGIDDDSDNALTVRLRARQRVELLKVPEIVDRVPSLLREGLSVAIFVNFDASAEALREKLSPLCGVSMLTGKYVKERQRFIDDFQSDKNRVVISNVAVGGNLVSLHDLHGNHPRHSIISPSDNAKEVVQLFGRIDRAGGQTPTWQDVLFAAGTVEEEVKDNCAVKLRRIGIFNEGIVDEIAA